MTEGFATDWQQIRPHLNHLPPELDRDDIFICPLCHQGFPRSIWSVLTLSLEHIPPEAVGGKISAVTCKSCNNRSGWDIDTHLIREQNYLDFWDHVKDTSWIGTYSVNDLPYDLWGKLTHVDHAEWLLTGDPKHTNPAQLQYVLDEMSNINDQVLKITFSAKGHSRRKSRLSLIRAAYLWGFAVLGYPFLFNRHFEAIRQQIVNSQKENSLEGFILENGLSQFPVGLNLIREPIELRSYLVVFDLKSKSNVVRRRGIILPAPFVDGMDIYERMAKRENSVKTIQFTTITSDYDMHRRPWYFLNTWATDK